MNAFKYYTENQNLCISIFSKIFCMSILLGGTTIGLTQTIFTSNHILERIENTNSVIAKAPFLLTDTLTMQVGEVRQVLRTFGTSGTCGVANGYSDSFNLPNFMTFETIEVTVTQFGTVRAWFEISVDVNATPGTYQGDITYFIFDNSTLCHTETFLYEFIITAALPPVADFDAQTTNVLEGGTILFADLSLNAISERLWAFGDGTTSTEINPSHQYNLAGTYSVSLKVTGPAGSDSLARNNYITVHPQGTPGIQIWAFDTEMSISHSPAIAKDGTIYVGGCTSEFNGYIHAINPNGTFKWAFNFPSFITSDPTVGPDGTIYFGSGNKKLYAVNSDGSGKWDFNTPFLLVCSPAIDLDSTIYIGNNRNIYAINPDGTQKWHIDISNPDLGAVNYQPAIGEDGTIYFGSTDNKLLAINPEGTIKWIFDAQQSHFRIMHVPAIGSDGTIYIGMEESFAGGDDFFALNRDGSLIWRLIAVGKINNGVSPTISPDGTIYFTSETLTNGMLHAINPNGIEKWSYTTENADRIIWQTSPTIGTNGNIYIAAADGVLHAVNENGVQVWTWDTNSTFVGSSPAIGGDGAIYIGSSDGILNAISSSSTGLARSPWPKLGQNNQSTGRNSNRKPTVLQSIPDMIFTEDSGTNTVIADLNDFFSDIDGDTLNFSTIVLGESITSTTAESALEISTIQDSFGVNSVIVYADDGIFSAVDTFLVTITPVNDAPIMANLPDLAFDEDGSAQLALNQFVMDVDDDTSRITFTVNLIDDSLNSLKRSSSSLTHRNNQHLARTTPLQQAGNHSSLEVGNGDLLINIDALTHVATFSTASDSFGQFTVAFTATDTSNASDSDTMTVTVTSVNDAPSTFELIAPEDSFKVVNLATPIEFLWSASNDIDGDELSYTFQLGNMTQDTVISDITDTTLVFDGGNFWKFGIFNWSVFVSDGLVEVASSDTFTIEYQETLGIDGNPPGGVPQLFVLHQNYPNPFNPSTTIKYDLPQREKVEIVIFNTLGLKVKTLFSTEQEPGIHEIVWDGTNDVGTNVGSGVYSYRIVAGQYSAIKKMILLR